MKSSAKKKPAIKMVAKATPTKPVAKSGPTRGLGKGLSALMSDTYSHVETKMSGPTPKVTKGKAAKEEQGSDAGQGAQRSLPLDTIRSGKYQPRGYFDETALNELADSIRAHGVMQPILVRETDNGSFEIIAGERRWRAARMAGLLEIPVLIQELTDEAALEIALLENIQRENLHPLEEATGYQRLMDEFGYTQEELSGVVHKSRSHIANFLRLIDLPDEVRQMLQSNQITMGHARALMGAQNPYVLAQEVVRRGLNVRQTEKLIRVGREESVERKPRAPRAGAETPAAAAPAYAPAAGPKDPDILALEETLSENLGLKVSINDRGQAGEIMIAYESLEQLDEILRRLGGSI